MPTSDRERECDRVKGDRARGGAGGSGESDKVIMTSSFPTRSGTAPELDAAAEEASVECESEGEERLFSGRCGSDCDCDSPMAVNLDDRRGKGEGVVARDGGRKERR